MHWRQDLTGKGFRHISQVSINPVGNELRRRDLQRKAEYVLIRQSQNKNPEDKNPLNREPSGPQSKKSTSTIATTQQEDKGYDGKLPLLGQEFLNKNRYTIDMNKKLIHFSL